MTSRSHAKLTSRAARRAGVGLIALAALVPLGTASGAVDLDPGCSKAGTTVHCDLWAKAGTFAPPGGGTPIPVMGYSTSAAGQPIVPGPAIVAEAGDTVEVVLHNDLSVPTGMLFQEQAVGVDRTGVPVGAATKTYSFTAGKAGTYLYEASPFVTSGDHGSQYQTAMGLYGALVVRPAGQPGQAYDATSAFDAEHLVVIGEVDKDLNTLADPSAFDMRNYSPDYFLINGKASPDTGNLAAAAGNRVLLRWVNAGVKAHTAAVLGAGQRLVGEDGNALPNPHNLVAETLGAGQTEDVVVALDAGASGKYPVYDSGLWLNNNSAGGMGGALTFLDVAGSVADSGPGTSGVAISGNALSATVSDAATGGGTVTAAEYFIDTVGTDGSGTAMDAFTPAVSASVSATLALNSGSHTIYVHGQDANGNWGPVSSVFYTPPDGDGPATKSLALSPNPSNATKNVALHATGDDTATGGSNVTHGEITIDGGTPDIYLSNGGGTVAAVDTVIPAATMGALAEGIHTVSIRSRDEYLNWGPPATVDLQVDKSGPTSTSPTATPSASNGIQGFSATITAVRVRATVTDGTVAGVHSAVGAGEGFIDPSTTTPPADGSGFPLVPADGTFGGVTENLQADIPLSTVVALPEGPHTIALHGRDSSGNWGPRVTTTLIADRTAPVASGLTASPNPTNNTAATFAAASNNHSFALNASATDTLTPVAGGEWFTGADPGTGKGTPMSATGGPTFTISATVDFVALGWLDGNRTIFARARDAAGNWSAPISVNVNIVRPNVIFANGFESGNASAWSGVSGANRLTFPTAASMAGTGLYGMQVRVSGTINNANPGAAYVTDNSPLVESRYRARFYFNPNNSNPGGGGNGIVIFRGYAGDGGSGANRFTIGYRLQGGTRQVRLSVVRSNGTTANSNWFNVANASATRLELLWQAGTNTSASLIVDPPGPSTGTLLLSNLNTGAGNRIESVRFGAQGLGGNTNSRAGAFNLDSFVSTRRTVIGS